MGGRSLIHRIGLEVVEANSQKIAEAILKQKLEWPEMGGCNPQYLYPEVRATVNQKIHKLRPETLGRIADQSRNLYSVHCGTWLDKHGTGRELLREICITGIVAEMTHIISERMTQ